MHKRFQLLAAMDLHTLVVKVGEEFHMEVEVMVEVVMEKVVVEIYIGMVAVVMEKVEVVEFHIGVVVVEIRSGMMAVVMKKVGEAIHNSMVGVVMMKREVVGFQSDVVEGTMKEVEVESIVVKVEGVMVMENNVWEMVAVILEGVVMWQLTVVLYMEVEAGTRCMRVEAVNWVGELGKDSDKLVVEDD